MAKVPATPLSIEYMEAHGCQCAIVERFIPTKPFPIKQDMFGVFDIVAVCLDNSFGRDRIGFIQTTSYAKGGGFAARRAKLEAKQELLEALIESGVRVYLHGWQKVNGRYEIICEQAERLPEHGNQICMVRREVISLKEVRATVRKAEADRKNGQLSLSVK